MILVEIVCAVTFLFSSWVMYASIFHTMNMIKNIWTLLFGMNKKIDILDDKIDELERDDSSILSNIIELYRVQNLILVELQKIQEALTPPLAVALAVKLSGINRGTNNMAQVSDTGSVSAVLEADDALGNAGAQLDAAPVWSLSDPLLGAVTAAADGLSAQVALTGKLGSFSLHVDALAGGKALAGDSEVVEVVVGAAAALKVAVTVA